MRQETISILKFITCWKHDIIAQPGGSLDAEKSAALTRQAHWRRK